MQQLPQRSVPEMKCLYRFLWPPCHNQSQRNLERQLHLQWKMKGMSRMSNAFITVSSLMSFFTARFRIVFFTYTKYLIY
jgi:hypothetical protein